MEPEIEKRKRGKSEEEKWVHDSSVDYKNRVPLRASTGVWKASLFLLSKIFTSPLRLYIFHHLISGYDRNFTFVKFRVYDFSPNKLVLPIEFFF